MKRPSEQRSSDSPRLGYVDMRMRSASILSDSSELPPPVEVKDEKTKSGPAVEQWRSNEAVKQQKEKNESRIDKFKLAYADLKGQMQTKN